MSVQKHSWDGVRKLWSRLRVGVQSVCGCKYRSQSRENRLHSPRRAIRASFSEGRHGQLGTGEDQPLVLHGLGEDDRLWRGTARSRNPK